MGEAMPPAAWLGARCLAPRRVDAAAPTLGPAHDALHCELLFPPEAVVDAWFGEGRRAEHRHGTVHCVDDGHWMHGSAQLDADAVPGGLEAAARSVYRDLFEALREHACPQLLRLWNYVPDINGDIAGLERYRRFNAGRQQAFIDAGRSAFEGAPAACAVGTPCGPLELHFLAGRVAPVAIENPRQVSAYHYPGEYGPRSPTFSRAALAGAGAGRQVLFVSGTASIVGHATVHSGDVRRQTEETLLNIDAVLHAAARHMAEPLPAHALTCTVYLRHGADLDTVLEVMRQRLGAASHAVQTVVVLRADICRAELLVEIEAHAFLPGGSGA